MAPFLDADTISIPTSPGTLVQESAEDLSTPTSPSEPEPKPSKKRKRDTKPVPEIEVDIEAPEPPSKKALRKAKKGKSTTKTPAPKLVTDDAASDSDEAVPTPEPAPAVQRSEYGIWIGNLPWVATKADLQKFLTSNADIEEESITRIHMPAPTQPTAEAARQKIKPQNKGFAYVDFSTETALTAALTLSEKLFSGRRVLIKNAKSYEGRPDPAKEEGKTGPQPGKPPSKRIFVGNLAFDTTNEELKEHFAKCGEVADCFITTFEDSGKCKGYGWVTFEELEGAVKAVRGWVNINEGEDDDEDEDGDEEEPKRPKEKKVRKWWVNRIKGRALRMEFAEDKTVRYKKRFGKAPPASTDDAGEQAAAGPTGDEAGVDAAPPPPKGSGRKAFFEKIDRKPKPDFASRREEKVDARTTKPGAALAGAHRLTGAIVQSKGKKITFE